MAQFPQLRSGAVMQFGSGQIQQWRTEILRFLDGQEQSYRIAAGPLRRWVIKAEALDEAELLRVQQFYEAQQGGAGQFSFTDPVDGQIYASCSFVDSVLAFTWKGQQRGSFEFVIRENRT